MKVKLSSRLNGVAESSTLKMNALAREMAAKGVKVVNLTAGEPDFPVPGPAKKAAIEAIEKDFSKYTPVGGIPELRKAISEKFKRENGLDYPPESVLVSVGAKQAIFNFFLAMLDPGDEVLIPAPYWVSYPDMVKIAGGKPVILPTLQKDGFKLKPEQVRAAITPKTKVFLMNSPSNPTGATYTRQEMAAIAKVLEGTSVWVLSDEIYEKLVYGIEFTSFAALSADAFARTVTVNGFSKAYAMTGWRLGYAAGPKEILAAMTLLQGQSTSNAHSASQKAALEALKLPPEVFAEMTTAFSRRSARMREIFAQCRDCSFSAPGGAFYLFLNIEPYLGRRYTEGKGAKEFAPKNSEEFAFFLLDAAQVVTVPGSGFGAEGYLRLSFAVSDSEVEEGCRRIATVLNQMH